MKTKVTNQDSASPNLHNDLIEACRRGDQRAQFQIYKLYYKAMYNTSLRIVKDAVEAEDIMQESFLSAFEKIGTYSGTVTFGAWLKKIVLNQSIDSVRRRKKIIFEGIESFKGAEENYFVASYQNEATDLLYRKVLDSIKSLPEKCRNIFSLHLLEGYDHEEISEILAISTSTSRSQYSRARSILRKEMKR